MDTLWLLKIYIMFYPPTIAKYQFFKLELMDYRSRHLWGAFQGLSSRLEWIDIIFDLFLDQRIQEHECNWRNQDSVVEAVILQLKQWIKAIKDSSNNKMELEQNFIQWIIKSYMGQDYCLLFLAGGRKH